MPPRFATYYKPCLKPFYMFENLQKYHIILASNSPRRKELLQRLGLDFKVRSLLGVDESYPPTLPAEEVAGYVARKKAEGYRLSMGKDELLIAADTVVRNGNDVLGKPTDREDALRMLRSLSGHTHQVTTGVAIVTETRTESFSVTSQVKFSTLTEEEITYYVDHFLPFDKAGAYGIQELIGLIGVEEIHGCFFNIVGLPVQRLYQALKQF